MTVDGYKQIKKEIADGKFEGEELEAMKAKIAAFEATKQEQGETIPE